MYKTQGKKTFLFPIRFRKLVYFLVSCHHQHYAFMSVIMLGTFHDLCLFAFLFVFITVFSVNMNCRTNDTQPLLVGRYQYMHNISVHTLLCIIFIVPTIYFAVHCDDFFILILTSFSIFNYYKCHVCII